jgi:hypothetical protein
MMWVWRWTNVGFLGDRGEAFFLPNLNDRVVARESVAREPTAQTSRA